MCLLMVRRGLLGGLFGLLGRLGQTQELKEVVSGLLEREVEGRFSFLLVIALELDVSQRYRLEVELLLVKVFEEDRPFRAL